MSVLTEHRPVPGSTWRAVLEPERAARARDAARVIASRVCEPAGVRAAVEVAAAQTAYPRSVGWDPLSVAQGDAGLAVLCSYLRECFPEEGWDVVAHELMARAVASAQEQPQVPHSLFGGLAGLGLAAALLADGGARYQRLRHGVDAALYPSVATLARTLSRDAVGMPVGQFDLISGLSGVAAYLLQAGAMPGTASDASRAATGDAIATALAGLVAMADDVDGLPRWYTPPECMHDEGMARQHPYGNLNCGLAHGIPGPLAVMSLAVVHGWEVRGLQGALRRLADWIVAHRSDDDAGVNWPTAVPLVPLSNGDRRPATRADISRSAWCYGSPGVARALWLAGGALDDTALRRLAVDAMAAIYRRPVAQRGIDSPTFCHGVAGLLQVTLRFAHDTGLPLFAEAAGQLTDQILAVFDPARLLGIANVEPAGNLVDQPGLLDGAPGVALVLLAAATDREPVWDRLFALS
jgi:hypothetical protein